MAFFNATPYIWVAEPDTKEPLLEIHKLRFTRGLPDLCVTLASDALHNLRDALDNVAYGLAVAAGKIHPLHTAFPFGGSAADFENNLGRCKDVPEEIHTVFRAYRPYKGGNDLLWALNKLAVTDKHKLLTIALNSKLGDVHAEGAIHHIPVNPAWDSAKREIEIFTGFAGQPVKGKIEIGLFVAFEDVPFVAGEPALKVLDYFVELVGDILSRLDTEGQRLGIFK